jgi:hypothetical protein
MRYGRFSALLQEETVMDEKPWHPKLDNPDEFLEHGNPLHDRPRPSIPNLEEDALDDIIAYSFEPNAPRSNTSRR